MSRTSPPSIAAAKAKERSINLWIYYDYVESPGYIYQIVGDGYIPRSPYGGRHVVDDFGNLVQALPSTMYPPGPEVAPLLQLYTCTDASLQYMFH